MNHKDTEAQRNALSQRVIGAAIEVHRHLGPGLLESAYQTCLAYELSQADLLVQQQLNLPLIYKGIQLDAAYRIDFLVENQLVLELKTVEKILPIHEAQLLSYLRLGDFSLGLLLNFHAPTLKDGIKRLKL
ncbi:GxxExxY protein [Deefgea sp. CFH1-16]|uniref:GxxExxY protein n=1 Tax=Deefgea sp. CFH1-16 TaxID=2675457 RepID=UPI0015F564A0|nr:GxxExxY protein [Deefgea sp. CFH1-16]MBM5575683.1 GxxExxY protein [Deefgea sp. CFH1-16]